MIDDAEIKIAVEADIQQFFTNSLTPDRGYGTPIDNVKKLIKKLTTELDTAKKESDELRTELKAAQTLERERNQTANTFMAQVKGLQLELGTRREEVAQLRAEVERLKAEKKAN